MTRKLGELKRKCCFTYKLAKMNIIFVRLHIVKKAQVLFLALFELQMVKNARIISIMYITTVS